MRATGFPAVATATVNIRTVPGQTVADVADQLRRWVADISPARSSTTSRSRGGPAELLSRVLDAPVLFFGVGLPEDRWHGSDERVSIEMLVNGTATLAYLWSRPSAPR
ncbi:hypothetical protein Ato02nite_054230 [Paractinoplanes toevensis]|uniref:Uncharacterized protein n=1 Tax=Paractinoplanes toevensis TaxID=571911 RepID=A0A919TDN7_9ACTN|nr:hypothetical protein Ato02nite_054230 [Actinoplanes toevensis]